MAMIFPLTAGLCLLAKPIVMLLSGPDFVPAIQTMRILSFVIIFIGLNGIIYMQMLMPQGQENIVTLSALIGAALNVMLNWLLIPRFAQDGAAFSSVVAEASILTVEIIIGWRYLSRFSFINKTNLDYIAGTCLMTAGILLTMYWIAPLGNVWDLLLYTSLGAAIYGIFLIWRRNHLYLYIRDMLLHKLNKS